MKYVKDFFALIPIFNSYPIWTQIVIFLCLIIIVSLLIFVPRITPPTKESKMADFTKSTQQSKIVQSAKGKDIMQATTIGDNSPIIGKIEIKSEQTIDMDYEVSSLTKNDEKYQRSVIIRNNSNSPAYNVHFSIKSGKQIINAPHPWPQGGGAIQTNYSKIIGNTYEAEVSTIPPRRYIKIVLQSYAEFEIEKVTIY